jgi:uncharacterized membrane protein
MLRVIQVNDEEGIEVSSRLFSFLILGVALILVGVVVLVIVSVVLGGSGSAGVVIFIGPFPIVFGKGPDAAWLILIGIIIAVLSTVLFLIMNRRFRGLEVKRRFIESLSLPLCRNTHKGRSKSMQ